ncbi:hypothetical protein TeGR_g1646 [Tetraparma gracilis]|uniref:Uncharacterized protein n=1 Tax=Tetraparma gracilis TaxID=2962635 RepID=A0ABQ6MDK0_9STRA|nr:hypothetical protein TeGR_g1646 [Tetraparma gracilis]
MSSFSASAPQPPSTSMQPHCTLRHHSSPLAALLPLPSSFPVPHPAPPLPSSHPFLLSACSSQLLLSDLQTRRVLSRLPLPAAPLGLSLTAAPSPRILLHLRGGAVSLHSDVASLFDDAAPPSFVYDPGSLTFCAAKPHPSDPHLLLSPAADPDSFCVLDARRAEPLSLLRCPGDLPPGPEKRGMVTALAFLAEHHLLAGHESSHVDLFDTRDLSKPLSSALPLPPIQGEAFPPCLCLAAAGPGRAAAGFAAPTERGPGARTLAFLSVAGGALAVAGLAGSGRGTSCVDFEEGGALLAGGWDGRAQVSCSPSESEISSSLPILFR